MPLESLDLGTGNSVTPRPVSYGSHPPRRYSEESALTPRPGSASSALRSKTM